MRTFIAINLDPHLKKTLEEFIHRLRSRGGDIRWVNPAGMHLTLKFLGETSEEKVAAVKESLSGTAHRYVPFCLRLSGTGTFPGGQRAPRVLWVGFEESSSLKSLQAEVEREMEKLGFPSEPRPFHPHLTLGRVKNPSGLGPLLREFEKDRTTVFGEMEVSRLTFFQSLLQPSGAQYIILAELPLG